MGVLRTLLALCVLAWHMPLANGGQTVPAIFPYSFVAVCGFFIISGFYMSLVLNETYDRTAASIVKFYINRAARIYVPYWTILLFFYIFVYVNLIHNRIMPQMSDPLSSMKNFYYFIDNILIFPHVVQGNINFSFSNILTFAQMSTVGLELIFYCAAPFIVSRNLPTLVTVFLFSVCLHVLPSTLGYAPQPWQYDFFPSIFVFFLAGSLSYRAYKWLEPKAFDRSWGWAALPVICFFGVSGLLSTDVFTNAVWPVLFYLFVSAAIPFLFLASKAAKWDRFIGDLSYPIYIVHFPVTSALAGHPNSQFLVPLWTVSLAVCVMLFVERPVDRWRHSISVPALHTSPAVERVVAGLRRRAATAAPPRALMQTYGMWAGLALALVLVSLWLTKTAAPVDTVAASRSAVPPAAVAPRSVGKYEISQRDGRYFAAGQAGEVIEDTNIDNLLLRIDSLRSGQPKLLATKNRFNIVVFKGMFYGLPFGVPIDWARDDVAGLRGVISDPSQAVVDARVTAAGR